MASLEIFAIDMEVAVNLAAEVGDNYSPMLLAAEAVGHEDPIALVQSIVCDPDPELQRQRQEVGDLVVGAAAARIAMHKRIEEAFGK